MSIFNLLPDDYLHRRLQRRIGLICTGLLAVVLAGVISASIISERNCGAKARLLASVDRQYSDAAQRIAEFQKLQEQKGLMLRKAEMTSSLLERVPRSFLLGIVTNSLPERAAVTTVDLYPKKVIVPAAPQPKAAPGGKAAPKGKGKPAKPEPAPTVLEIEITGVAQTDVEVAKFIANLAQQEVCESVDLVYSQQKALETGDGSVKNAPKPVLREFQIRVVLKSNIDVLDLSGQTAQAPASGAPAGDAL